MQAIDYEASAHRRRENYEQLDQALRDSNLLHFELEDDSVPMVYPYMTQREGLRQHLIDNKVFVAQYWPDVLKCTNEGDWEHKITLQLLPLPIDQRYGSDDMKRILKLLKGS